MEKINEIIEEKLISIKKEITTYWYNLYNLFIENIDEKLKQIEKEKNEIFEYFKNNEKVLEIKNKKNGRTNKTNGK